MLQVIRHVASHQGVLEQMYEMLQSEDATWIGPLSSTFLRPVLLQKRSGWPSGCMSSSAWLCVLLTTQTCWLRQVGFIIS